MLVKCVGFPSISLDLIYNILSGIRTYLIKMEAKLKENYLIFGAKEIGRARFPITPVHKILPFCIFSLNLPRICCALTFCSLWDRTM